MTEQPRPGDESQRIEYDPEHVIARLHARLADIIGTPAAAAELEAARLEAMVRRLATDTATQTAQLAELRGKLDQQQRPTEAAG